ncbi:anti-sigma-I factor RsgI family protein [Gracilibacillus alcaliphilus]|uniref:anti-sigma-I factor RsgI family protein n=1 Tax=Gracilibacillus alcaliphilus TaxID=1401441 RepID=UPI00195D4377|nr:hypothetical protein [Gracilibacillus alcaliphilus]MBM7675342.1 hypothetical protein [Gracilibacillus alcaliphilus]
MKKGIIVEHRSHYTIIMDNEGMFHKAEPIQEKDIGVETAYQPKTFPLDAFFVFLKRGRWTLLSMVLICLLCISPLYLLLDRNEAYAVVSLDVHPSLTIKVDENYKVLDVMAMNKVAQDVVQQLETKGKTLITYTDDLLTYLETQDNMSPPASLLMAFSYYGERNGRGWQENIKQHYQDYSYPVVIYEVSEKLRKKAENESISMNQAVADLLAAEEAAEIQPVFLEQEDSNLFLNQEQKELIKNFYQAPSFKSTELQEINSY